MGDLTESQRGMIVGAYLVGASVATVANVVGVSKGTVFNVMRAYSMHGQTTSAKQNSGHSSKCEDAYPVVQRPQRVDSKAVETRNVVRLIDLHLVSNNRTCLRMENTVADPPVPI
ncbi:hypothetical protein C0J52_10787 [Blattella germanica]|nr:hypothetical protein C0J52_10787 [Blattella germanica]